MALRVLPTLLLLLARYDLIPHVAHHTSHVTLLLLLLVSNFLPNRAAALRFLSTAFLVLQKIIEP
jgi:hypothetical protein